MRIPGRALLLTAILFALIGCQSHSGGVLVQLNGSGGGVTPVSYTHLDVYKRQHEQGAILERAILDLSKATDAILKRYGKGVVERQFPMKRLADAATDIFVGLCVLSRVSKMCIRDRNGS